MRHRGGQRQGADDLQGAGGTVRPHGGGGATSTEELQVFRIENSKIGFRQETLS